MKIRSVFTSQKDNQRAWYGKKGKVPRKCNIELFTRQVMLTAFWDCCSLEYSEFGSDARKEKWNVTKDTYFGTLMHLRNLIQRNRHDPLNFPLDDHFRDSIKNFFLSPYQFQDVFLLLYWKIFLFNYGRGTFGSWSFLLPIICLRLLKFFFLVYCKTSYF